ncbi:MAG: carbohydrate ABC transporter permease [Chloroflexi bacterium]|nr:carbohydrate ABC transporter permease [Chloroflexota bacterium]
MARAGRRLQRLAIFAILSVAVVVMLFPFAYMLLTSFRSYDQFLAGSGFSLDSWQGLFDELPVVQQMINSAIVTGSSVALILFASTTAGYAFAKLRFPVAPLLFVGILAGMMIPVQSIIIPEFVNIANAGLINQYPGPILVYAALGIPFGTYLMTTYFRGVPTELVEASLMDGASYRQIFIGVMVPLAVPAIVTVAVLQFIQIWGDLLIGLLFLNQPDVRTITVGLATLQSARIIPVPMIMAGSILSLLPAVIVYLFFQRQLIAGLTMGMGK